MRGNGVAKSYARVLGVGSGVFYICCSGGLNQSLAMLVGRGVVVEWACEKRKRLLNIWVFI